MNRTEILIESVLKHKPTTLPKNLKYRNSTCACDYTDVMGALNGDEHFASCPLAGALQNDGFCRPLDRKELERRYLRALEALKMVQKKKK